MPAICLSLTEATIAENLAVLRREAPWTDMVELRGDFLAPAELSELAAFPDRLAGEVGRLPIILTVRRPADGGHFAGTEAQRRRYLAEALQGRFDFVDLEDDLFDEEPVPDVLDRARTRGIRSVRSRHDFDGPPESMVPELLRMGADGSIPKLAVAVRDSRDLLALFHAYDVLAGRDFVLLGMGQRGVPTRVLCLAYGSQWTYASAPGAAQAAPGHLSPQVLVERYRARQLNRHTALFGVVGNPIAHSRSPEYHNDRFRRADRNAVYLPFEAEDFGAFAELAEHLHIQGLSVTIPHKGSAAQRAGELSSAVRAIGACNTLIRRRDGGWYGTNTDVEGFMKPLEALIASRGRTLPERATVVGAGGVARAAVYALLQAGVSVLVVNRTPERAEALAAAMREHLPGLGDPTPLLETAPLVPDSAEGVRSFRGLIVQTTSQGMTPQEDRDPLSFYPFQGDELVYDLIYTPDVTRLLSRAQEAGCVTLSGKDMFTRQAEAQGLLFDELLDRVPDRD